MKPEVTQEWVDHASMRDLLERVRFDPMGSELFQSPLGERLIKRLGQMREQDPAGYTAASKSLGWKRS